ncbi:MAG: SUMF1/EgtB/PvdO family nonheme iron enzyme [Magnetococcales bacterium]|nr:SUMF1/EgtB/PvdO family nonheme iron enzyme [Magnetococcales bacterium]
MSVLFRQVKPKVGIHLPALSRCDRVVESTHPGLDEAQRLAAIAQRLIHLLPEHAHRFSSWLAELATLTHGPDLETLAGEKRLEQLSMALRAIWLAIAHAHGDPHLKSPPRGTCKKLPLGQEAHFVYERCVYPNHLEGRGQGYRNAHPAWQAGHLVFRCGMAAIITLFHALIQVLKPTVTTPLRLEFFGGYYETGRAFRMFDAPWFTLRRIPAAAEWLQRIREGRGDLLFLEPVPYDWEMGALDWRELLAALRSRAASPVRMIIVDSTLVGPTFPMAELLTELAACAAPPLVVQLNSALKLDQEGWELANAGVVTLYGHQGAANEATGRQILQTMREQRKILGNALSMDEMSVLDFPMFLDHESHWSYCRGVFHNNRLLAESIQPGGFFPRVVHPALARGAEHAWAVAPFVVFHFRPEFDTERHHQRLIAGLRDAAKRRGFDFPEGMSFGFRGHRFEIIKPHAVLHPNGAQLGVLKVAMGRRAGPGRDGVIGLLREVAQCRDFAALESVFAQVAVPVRQEFGRVGQGRYRLEERIGAGTFAEVFRARCVATGAEWAIKRASSEVGLRVLQWESENLTRLQGCPFVLPMQAYWLEPDGCACLLSAYLDGGDLKSYVRAQGGLAEVEALTILERVARAVAFAQGLKPPLIHRDIKPDNILGQRMDGGGMAWFLADWGLAKSWQGHHAPRLSGTSRYTPPEVWKKKRYLVSDVYALGMTFYFMLFGQPAYNGDSDTVARGQCAPEPVVIPEGCPEGLRQLLEGMLAKDPRQRWSVAQVLERLRVRLEEKKRSPRVAIRIGRVRQRRWVACHGDFSMEFVWIPPGHFQMGMAEADADHADRMVQPFEQRCGPRHRVSVDGFWMARFPVTRGQFRYFVRDAGYRTTAERVGWARGYVAERDCFERREGSSWEQPGFVQGEDHPVVNVSHEDATAFAEWLSWRCGRLIRLPTEAEWERACRAGGEGRFSCGEVISADQANYGGVHGGTLAVGSHPANGFGLHDLHGQVYEWVRDWFAEDFYRRSPGVNPCCQESDSGERVLRGGSWHASAWRIRSAARDRYAPERADGDIGFRLSALAYPWEERR